VIDGLNAATEDTGAHENTARVEVAAGLLIVQADRVKAFARGDL